MPVPLRIILRHVRPTVFVRQDVTDRVEALQKFHPKLAGCRVVVEMPHRHRAAGNRYHVRIELKLPGEVIVVAHEPLVRGAVPADDKLTKAAEADVVARYLHVAIHDAFEAARRRLRDVATRQRSTAKTVARLRRTGKAPGIRQRP